MKKRILITDDVHPIMLETLENAEFDIDYYPDISLEEVRKIISPYYGVIINSKIKADKFLLNQAEKLKFIGRLGSGLDIIDLDLADSKGIRVFSAPEGNRNAVAEHALGMLLGLMNNLYRADFQVKQKHWQREMNRGTELMGQTIGVIGFGNTGSSFVSKLSGFGVNVLIYDKYKNYYAENLGYTKEATLENLLEKSNVISLHLPLTSETHHFVNRVFLEKCQKGVIIINTSRGKIIHTQDLLTALRKGKVGGACLDVLENENPHTYSAEEEKLYSELFGMSNVVLSPHVAGWTVESKKRIAEVLLSRIMEL